MYTPGSQGPAAAKASIGAAEARAAASPAADGPSFASVLREKMDGPARPWASSARMTPAEVALALRPPVSSAPSGAAVPLPPALSNPLIWQVGLRPSPLPAAPHERFDAFRTRLQQAPSSPQTTLDIRVTETNGRDVRQVPDRRAEWSGRLNGARLVSAIAALRRGRSGWSELADLVRRAQPRLARLQGRWSALEAGRPTRVGEALTSLGRVLDDLAGTVADKRVDALAELEKAAQQAQQAMNAARGRA